MRKRVVLVLTGVLLIWKSLLFGQNIPKEIIGAFKKGDSQKLEQYLGNKIDLAIQDQVVAATDRQHAEKEIAAFFASNEILGFEVNHEGNRDESCFVIGTLDTKNGRFRINCFFKKEKEKYIIHQIRIDKINE